ncbi:hypothetical protein ACFVIM_18675 [Streptomyces sp. NPDC057638]|uniref:hypothetical protein n=1 Tax=Streptomyces sp. NPDC057638 TaxID=3346190 RepID=UPI0036B7B1BA
MYSGDSVFLANVDSVIGGVEPNWGPFGALGGTAKVIIGAIAALVLVICAGIFLVGIAKSKGWLGSGNSTMQSDQGKGMIIGGLTGIFLVASAGAIFGLVYAMGI